jgi:hypothetical protein
MCLFIHIYIFIFTYTMYIQIYSYLSLYYNQYGRTALIMASLNGHIEVVVILLERGASVNAARYKVYIYVYV